MLSGTQHHTAWPSSHRLAPITLSGPYHCMPGTPYHIARASSHRLTLITTSLDIITTSLTLITMPGPHHIGCTHYTALSSASLVLFAYQ
ncbi:hypothetical protein E2C01_085763 [Portunus trituberculatus]|uniref:Uncharacterized protein n=1 Tax=Portunus trituberculatus TaxID=210409 RepID=A0A5B7JEJ1_PORTR|nr:hypothetical protein [Portunus trituberculatus]